MTTRVEPPHTTTRGTVGVGIHHYCIYHPFPYATIGGDGVQEQEQQYYQCYAHPRMMRNHRTTTTLAPSSLPPMMISSPSLLPPQSYFMHYPSTMTTTSISTGYNTIRQHQQQYPTNPYYYYYNNERNNNDDEVVAVKLEANNLSTNLRRLPLEERRTADSEMTSTVVVHNNNNSLSQKQCSLSNDETTMISPTTSNQRNKVEKQVETKVTDDKVVSVCKQTITYAIQKVVIDDYVSALHKLRKTIRILDILMFREGSSGIGSAKIETIRPWLNTLKDMEQRVSLKENYHQNSENRENGVLLPRAKYGFLRQVRKQKHYIISSNTANVRNTSMLYSRRSNNGNGGGVTCCNCWMPNIKRYRTTGKMIVK